MQPEAAPTAEYPHTDGADDADVNPWDQLEDIFGIEEQDNGFSDLVSAAESSFAFWDNPPDDEDWNNT